MANASVPAGPLTAGARATPAAGRAGFSLTPVLQAYARNRLDQLSREDAALAQRRQQTSLVAKAAGTKFGKHHDFAGIRTVADYQKRVPLRTYGQLWDEYWKRGFPDLVDVTWPGRIPYFAVSSGTTSGKVKHIPCSVAMARANQKAALDTLSHHLGHTPDSRLLDGPFFMLGGSTDLKELAPGVLADDISGIAAHRRPWWSRPYHFPPRELRFITDWEEKIARMAPLSLERAIRGLSGAPGWLLVLFERLASLRPHTPGRIVDLYPDLELIIHGGVSFAPYKARFDALLEGSKVRTREVYAASEGYVAIADRGPGEGMRLVADNGMFFEFVPVDEIDTTNPTRCWVGDVEPGVDYAIALTTCAGLWSYLIGDVVRFVDTRPPRLHIVGRTSYMLSSFGE
ncbi:MAG TPA: GH3 auxin-responsive promoter family protein, partial [Geminicoccaceae bacterium]